MIKNWTDFFPLKEYKFEWDGSVNDPNGLPLPDGIYSGMLSAHCFVYDGKKYQTNVGIRTMTPQPYTLTVKNGQDSLI